MLCHFLIDSIDALIFPALIVLYSSMAVVRHENLSNTAKVLVHMDMSSDPSGRLIKGKTLEGINYCINQEEALKVFLDDGEVPLDNNATEGALRSFCLHKHAWKLIDSIDGAKSSAIVYSITETAKANNLNPFRYLEYVLTVMKDHQEDTDYRFMEDLLPWSEQLPEICRSKTKATNV